MKRQKIDKNSPQRILAFNSYKKLVGIFQSTTAAANIFNVNQASIHNACIGKTIACSKMYFRHLYEDKIELAIPEDLGVLDLKDYDQLMGLQMRYHKGTGMTRKGMKYQKHNNETDD